MNGADISTGNNDRAAGTAAGNGSMLSTEPPAVTSERETASQSGNGLSTSVRPVDAARLTRSELANLRVRAERMVHVFSGVGVGLLIADLLAALDAKLEEE